MTGTADSGGRPGLRGTPLPSCPGWPGVSRSGSPDGRSPGLRRRGGGERGCGAAAAGRALGSAECAARPLRLLRSKYRSSVPPGQGRCHSPAAGDVPGPAGRPSRGCPAPAPDGQLWQGGKAAVRLPGSRTSDLYLMKCLFFFLKKVY